MTHRRIRLGMLTPSSNTTLEPVTAAMLAALPDVTAHAGRFRVTQIALSDAANRQFDDSAILAAAELLADAKVDVIAWNGTSASWLGFETDERLVARITAATGISAVTCVLGYRDLLVASGVRRVGLVTPYTADVQERIRSNWAASGFICSAERHLGIAENFAFAEVAEAEVERLVREVAAEGCDGAAIVCTNVRGAAVAARLERELGIAIYDSVAVTLWACLGKLGVDMTPLAPWGRVFTVVPPNAVPPAQAKDRSVIL